MSSETPLISVIIPAYNAASLIERTLRSVLAQTYQNLEVLVVDDGSTDQTSAVVAAIAHQDPRVKLLHQANAGVAAARNLAIAQAQGEFIAPMDADDLWYPENLEKQVQCLIQGGPQMGLVYSWSVDIDEQDALLGGFRAAEIQGQVYATLVCHNFLGNASASMIRRSCLEQVGWYESKLRSQQAQGCEDWDLYLRIAEKFEFGVVPAFLVGYRKLTASMSGDYQQMARSHTLVMQAVRQRHPELPAFVFRLSSSNLYFYFAHQSHRSRSHRTTLYWLGQSIQADPLSCWIRLGLYRLTIQSVWGSVRGSQKDAPGSPAPQSSMSPPLNLADIEQRQGAIALMVMVGNGFHRFISRMAQRPMPSACSLTPTGGVSP